MKTTALETIRIAEFPNLIWLKMHTSEGIVGLEETFFFRRRSRPAFMTPLHRSSSGATRFRSKGSRRTSWAASAAARPARKCGQHRRLTSRSWTSWTRRPDSRSPSFLAASLPTRSVRTTPAPAPHTCRRIWGRARRIGGLRANQRRYDDLNGFAERADELAQELLNEGITAMKIWPFDMTAEANDGVNISNSELKRALEPFEKIRPRGRRKNGGNRRIPFHFGNCCRRFELRALSRPTTRSRTRTRSKWTVSQALSRYARPR